MKYKILNNLIFAVTVIILLFTASGCLIFHSVSYEIKLNPDKSGTTTVLINDIRSNAKTDENFEEDKNNLFSYMLKSDEFVESMRKNRKNIIKRELYLNGDTLMGKGVYKFDNIKGIEGIEYEGGFYFLTLGVDDSVVSTNGEIIRSKDYKRILWDSKINPLKFEMFSFSFDKDPYRKLAQYYESYK
ncbi:MAG: hypothetical protein WCE54_06255 [Ignavibacteriaceae bacterium]